MTRALAVAVALVAMGCGSLHVGNGGGGGSGGGDGGVLGSDGGGTPDDGSIGGGHGTWYNRTYQDANGARDYHVYVPAAFAGKAAPLVMVLHGCTQTGMDAAQLTNYPALADADGFLLVFPDQDAAANATRCWNWFLADDQKRDQGEPALLAGIVGAVGGEWPVDGKRVFVIGGSAGAAMAIVLGATYPDRFAAVGSVAGCEFGGLPCGMNGGPDPKQQGAAAYSAMGSYARVVPVIVFQGDADPVVAPVNAEQIVSQWLATDDLADDGHANGSDALATPTMTSGQVPNGESYDVARYLAPSSSSSVLIERWLVHGAGHAWPGGAAGATFSDPSGPDATGSSWSFFVAHPQP